MLGILTTPEDSGGNCAAARIATLVGVDQMSAGIVIGPRTAREAKGRSPAVPCVAAMGVPGSVWATFALVVLVPWGDRVLELFGSEVSSGAGLLRTLLVA